MFEAALVDDEEKGFFGMPQNHSDCVSWHSRRRSLAMIKVVSLNRLGAAAVPTFDDIGESGVLE